MKSLLTLLIITLATSLWADEIYLSNGRVLKGKVVNVSSKNLHYIPENETSVRIIPRGEIKKFIYDDGTEVDFEHVEKTRPLLSSKDREQEKEEEDFRLVWEDKTVPLLLPFPLTLNLHMMNGDTTVKIFDSDKKEIASGKGDFKQYMGIISYDQMETDFYITPELGYFYREVQVKDYSFRVDEQNALEEGFKARLSPG